MKRIQINTYLAFLIIIAVSAGCAWLIISTANSAEAQAASLNSEINGTTK